MELLGALHALLGAPLVAVALRLWASWARRGGRTRLLGGVLLCALGLDGLRQLWWRLRWDAPPPWGDLAFWGLAGGLVSASFFTAWRSFERPLPRAPAPEEFEAEAQRIVAEAAAAPAAGRGGVGACGEAAGG
ncbi:MAG: hypothetical protein D6731_05745, partial [Planctomycetota bacterium]